ncbi:MAG TPA: hypothetical protein VIH37_09370, partial [Candidatus Limnocylindrales bacterium]
MTTPRLVEVAVDAPGGPGPRTWTYAVPPELADLVPGEAVLVPFGRRQAIGIVLGDAAEREKAPGGEVAAASGGDGRAPTKP